MALCMSEPNCRPSNADSGYIDAIAARSGEWEHPAMAAAREATALPRWWPLAAAFILVGTIAISVVRPWQWWAA